MSLADVPTPEPRSSGTDAPPAGAFTIGINGVGVVEAVRRDVRRLEPVQRAETSRLVGAPEIGDGAAQIVMGLASIGAALLRPFNLRAA